MDYSDEATQQEELNLRVAAANQAARAAQSRLQPCGRCYYCNEVVPASHLFCDNYCRDDYEDEQRIRANQGLRRAH